MSTAVQTRPEGARLGTPHFDSVGAITFSPDGVLFVADNRATSIVAIETGTPIGPRGPITVDNLDGRLASYLGCAREDVFVKDMAAHPTSGEVYLSVMRGAGESAEPVIVKVGPSGAIGELALENVRFSTMVLDDAPAEDDTRVDGRVVEDPREGEEITMRNGGKLRITRDRLRTMTVTDLAYVDGTLLVTGASNEEFTSSLRRIPFPFSGESARNSLEIFHVSHGKYETSSPIRAFVPYENNTSILATYTCTPLVHFAVNDILAGTHLMGRTVADVGAGSTPLDLVSFERDGETYLLISNTSHPLMKVKGSDVDAQEALTQPKEPLGIPVDNLPQAGVSRMTNLGNDFILMLQRGADSGLSLNSYATASL